MPRILELCDDFAERFAFEPSKVAGIAKTLRDAGLIKAGPRGVNAPPATTLDAVRILLAMMLRVKHHEAAEAVRLFGSFVPVTGEAFQIGGRPAENFEEGFVRILDWCAFPFDDSDKASDYFGPHNFEISILRDHVMAQITILRDKFDEEGNEVEPEERIFGFCHPEYGDFEKAIKEGRTVSTANTRNAMRRYRSGFHEVPNLRREDLIAIAQVIAGHQPLHWVIE